MGIPNLCNYLALFETSTFIAGHCSSRDSRTFLDYSRSRKSVFRGEDAQSGFQALGQLSFTPDGNVGLIAIERERAEIGGRILGVPLLEDGLSQCWGCMDRPVCKCKLDPEQCSCSVEIRGHFTQALELR